jgi:hypothetical protein
MATSTKRDGGVWRGGGRDGPGGVPRPNQSGCARRARAGAHGGGARLSPSRARDPLAIRSWISRGDAQSRAEAEVERGPGAPGGCKPAGRCTADAPDAFF